MNDAKDFSQHPLIEQLLPVVNASDFSEVFTRASQDLASNERFLLKMELKRQGGPCTRVIDLRGKVDGECQEFIDKGITHFMDEIAIKLYKKLVKQFHGQYNTYIYEELQHTENNFRIMQQNNITPIEAAKRRPKKIIARAVRLGHYITRLEQRMHLISPLRIARANGSEFDATSSNMSVSGLRTKVPVKLDFAKGEIVTVYFVGLEKEFVNRILSAGTEYKIVGIDKKNNEQWLRMIVIDPDEEFQHFFNHYLRSYRGRYRVDVENITASVITKGYEHYLVPRVHGIPLFFSNDQLPKLQFALSSNNNQDALAYWRDEGNQSHLGQLFHGPRLLRLLEQPQGECLIFCFTHTANNKLFFFSATDAELEEHSELRQLYMAYGSRKPTWRVFRFQWQHSQLSDFTGNTAFPKKDNSSIAQERVERSLRDLCMVGLLTDISEPHADKQYQHTYALEGDPNKLAYFNQSKHPLSEFEQVAYKHQKARKEDRYQYRSLVEVKDRKHSISAWCADFSIEGLKIEVETALSHKKDDIISLALPQFQTLVKNYDLSKLKYRVAYCNPAHSIYHLQVHHSAGKTHEGSRFFKQLIGNNLDKLNIIEETQNNGALSEALHQLFCMPMFSRAMYINRHPGSMEVGCISYGQQAHAADALYELDPSKQQADLSAWLNKQELHLKLCQITREMQPSDNSYHINLIIAIDKEGKILAMRDMSSFTDLQLQNFININVMRGKVVSLRLSLCRVGRPDTQFIQRELDYISQYAIHKAKQLEDELWSVIGVIEITDTSQELFTRFNMTT